MPTLDWLNKAQALKTAAPVPYRLLEPQSVHGDPAAGNWLIQGDMAGATTVVTLRRADLAEVSAQ
jgi:hypothetical protein